MQKSARELHRNTPVKREMFIHSFGLLTNLLLYSLFIIQAFADTVCVKNAFHCTFFEVGIFLIHCRVWKGINRVNIAFWQLPNWSKTISWLHQRKLIFLFKMARGQIAKFHACECPFSGENTHMIFLKSAYQISRFSFQHTQAQLSNSLDLYERCKMRSHL